MTRKRQPFRPASAQSEESKSRFAVRVKEFGRVMADIRGAQPGDSLQHFLFVGGHGSGKTTLLKRILAEIQCDTDLIRRMVAVYLPEEQAAVLRLHDLWESVSLELGGQGVRVQRMEYDESETDLTAVARLAFAKMHAALKKSGRQLVLLLDNIDRVFHNIGDESALLREQLMNHPEVRLIGTCGHAPDFLERYDHAFFHFFLTKHLAPLTMTEIQALLEIQDNVGRNSDNLYAKHLGFLQAARMLSDGMPGTMNAVLEDLISYPALNSAQRLERLLGQVAPVYRAILLNLSPQQQKIALELAFCWESGTVEQLIPACRLPGKVISSQLNVLAEKGVVVKLPGEKRSYHYRLENRYLNLWLVRTQGMQKQKAEVEFLLEFLQSCLGKPSIGQVKAKEKAAAVIKHLLDGDISSFQNARLKTERQILAGRYLGAIDYCLALLTVKQFSLVRQLLQRKEWEDCLEKRMAGWIMETLESRKLSGMPGLPEELNGAVELGVGRVLDDRLGLGIS